MFRKYLTPFAITIFMQLAALSAPPLSVVQDTLFKADGSRFDGFAEIEWNGFQASDGSEVPRQSLVVRITSGSLRVELVPTTNALKTAYYTVKYTSNGKAQFTEYWAVPPSGLPLKLRDVRTASPIAGGIAAPISAVGITDVLGLRSELDLRPARGVGYLSSRAAIINSNGSLDAVIGTLSDCVRVDGTSGPCGTGGGGGTSSIIYVDGENPSGAIDSSNLSFNLAAPPNPAMSLALFRNGVLLQQGNDFTLSGSTIIMTAGRPPTIGDRLQAWYRITNGSSTITFVDSEVPTGLVNGVNTTFVLSGIPLPASSLAVYRNGILQRPSIDYDLAVNQLVFKSGAIPQPSDILQAFYRK